MIEKNDWRLQGQEAYLKNVPLYFIPFAPYSPEWDHEHCEFCWAKFYLDGENLKEGYCTMPGNCREARWICPVCYADFKELFGWSQRRTD